MMQHNRDLSRNQQGKDVALLHRQLINIGYTIDTQEILGEIFGESTFQAVLLFQQRERLRPTGVVDAVTAQAIVNRYEPDKTVIPAPAGGVVAAPLAQGATPSLALGATGEA